MTTRRVLVDTGPLVALRNARDQHRARIQELARELPQQLYTCWPVLTEATYLLREHPEEVQVLLEGVRQGVLVLLPLTAVDAAPVAAILKKYADQSFSLADAALMHLAEREDITEVLTVDPHDFSVFRTAKGSSLKVIA
jgi:predicted nucleic acid-binding protein